MRFDKRDRIALLLYILMVAVCAYMLDLNW